jgi:endonuclease/exonuclease/phosphatase family metal-dependent hydrolase
MMSTETSPACWTPIERLRQSHREIKADIAALQEVLARRRQQREEQDFTAYYRDEEFDA